MRLSPIMAIALLLACLSIAWRSYDVFPKLNASPVADMFPSTTDRDYCPVCRDTTDFWHFTIFTADAVRWIQGGVSDRQPQFLTVEMQRCMRCSTVLNKSAIRGRNTP